jgi:predicted nucleic acid-binding protein
LSLVLDASVALAWCFEDERTPSLSALLDRVADDGAIAPQLWPLEVLNGLASAERRGRIGPEDRLRLAGFLRRLPVTIDADTAANAWDAIADLSAARRVTVHDAAYLELAIRAGLPLATADAGLAAAARASGVEVVG